MSVRAQRASALAGTVGASLGLAAGLAELTVGPSIRSWVGNKADTTRLGLATIVLAALALAAALVLLRRPRAPAPARLALAVGLLLPGLICFTTAGRLWFPPGVLLVGAGLATVVDVRGERHEVATVLGRNWTAVLTVVLGVFYVFLGATALGLAGGLGILGGLLAIALVAVRGALPTPVALGLLAAAALPFAALTWWSVATPLIGLLLLALGTLAIRAARRRRQADGPSEMSTPSSPISPAAGWSAELPAPVRRYLDRVLPAGGGSPRQVRLTQVGEMCQKPAGRWLSFTAVEELAVEDVAFSWRARFPIAPFVWLRVVDRYTAGEGLLEGRLWGLLRVIRVRGREVAEGEALRYLAELVWAPQAMLANRRLEWRELDPQTVEVSTLVGPARVAVRLEFDPAGDIVGTWCDARPYLEGKTSVPRPWAGRFSDYAVVGGIRIPTRGEVRWELPDGPFTYWRGTITSLELDP